jgi:hypothetical protein
VGAAILIHADRTDGGNRQVLGLVGLDAGGAGAQESSRWA